MLLSISEIVKKTVSMRGEDEKIEFLRKNKSLSLVIIMRLTYDPNVTFLVPNTPPPWKKNDLVDLHGRLYQETRRLKIFIKGGPYDGKLSQLKMEQLFIELLESVDDADAEILVNMIQKKKIMGISLSTLEKAFPEFYQIDLLR